MTNSPPETLHSGEYFGTVVKCVEVADSRLALVRHDEQRLIPLHQHECAYFCLLLHGRYTECYGAQTIDYLPFMMALHPPGFRHSDEIVDAGSVFFMVALEEVWIAKLAEVIDLKAVKVELRGNDLVWLAMRLFKLFTEFAQESALHVESLLYELVAGAARFDDVSKDANISWLQRALVFLDSNFTEGLSMKQIAEAAGVHPVTLARAFRVHHQQTVSEYINRLRVRLGCEKLLSGDTSLATISAECGFVDQSYFTKVFKGFTGTTPAALRHTLHGALE